ncbi:MAG TPA: hypothetical protein VK474_02645 [Chthoniobacterales bacterium]|nr:hypothetical protein [Chthoniobacterales bacterium]
MKGNKDAPKKGFTYKPQFAVIVICEDETRQKRVYEQLLKKGFKLRVVVV